MLVVTGIEAEVRVCSLRCTCGHHFVESDFLDADNVVGLTCSSCGDEPLKIVFGSKHAREFFGELEAA